MAEPDPERENLLRAEYLSQTARIHWHELLLRAEDLARPRASGRFEQWIAEGSVAPVTEEQARAWYEANPALWAVVAAPWVLVQQRAEEASVPG